MANISIDRRYWVEDSVPRAWPPGQDVFTGEDNPKANYALDLNIDGKVMTFIPSSVINNGVYNPFGEVSKGRIFADKSYYMPWFLDPNNQKTLAETGSRVDLADSSVGKYLKDKMGTSTDGVLVPKGSIPFDSQIVNAPGKVQGIGNINGQNVYVNEDVNKTGRTFFTDPAGQTREYIAPSGGGGFLGGLLGDIGNIGEGVVGGIKDFGSNVDDAVRENVPGGWGTVAALVGAYYGPEISASMGFESGAAAGAQSGAAAGGATAGGATAASAPFALTGADAALADLAASAPAFGAPAAAGTTLAGVAGNADKAALLGDAGYGAGMTAAQTGAYDAGLAAGVGGAGAAAANAGAGAAGGKTLADILPYTTAASVAGSVLGANAAQNAADAQTAAANAAIAQQQKNFETISAQQAPYRAAGYNTLNEIAKLSSGQTPTYDYMGNIVKDADGKPVMQTGSGYFTKQFTPEDFSAGMDPGYAFRLQQGQMANQRAANVGGGALSGNTLKGLQDYTQGLASQEYGNAFNRFQTQRQNIYNTLASIAGIGQTGQTATNTAATNATNAATQLGVGSAAAQAAGGVGAANAYTNAINNATNNYTLATLLNQRGNVAMPIG
jgi:hypothetical protein